MADQAFKESNPGCCCNTCSDTACTIPDVDLAAEGWQVANTPPYALTPYPGPVTLYRRAGIPGVNGGLGFWESDLLDNAHVPFQQGGLLPTTGTDWWYRIKYQCAYAGNCLPVFCLSVYSDSGGTEGACNRYFLGLTGSAAGGVSAADYLCSTGPCAGLVYKYSGSIITPSPWDERFNYLAPGIPLKPTQFFRVYDPTSLDPLHATG